MELDIFYLTHVSLSIFVITCMTLLSTEGLLKNMYIKKLFQNTSEH